MTGGLLTGCAALVAPGSGLPPLPAAPQGAYRLGAGDELQLRIYNQSDLSGSYRIDDSGMIDMPLLDLVPAAGLTTAELSESIADALRSKNLILNASVAAEISTYRPFYILGEVNQSGQFAYRPGMSILTAISIAGGFTYRAEQDYVGVTRNAGGAPVQYRAAPSALAAPGDVITVFERRF